jgi:hypothetical protein
MRDNKETRKEHVMEFELHMIKLRVEAPIEDQEVGALIPPLRILLYGKDNLVRVYSRHFFHKWKE